MTNALFQPPPTVKDPILHRSGNFIVFDPTWLQWYIDLIAVIQRMQAGEFDSLTIVGDITYGGQLISTVVTGTAPMVVASTTEVANLHAATATKLQTARTIGGVLFDGTINITVQTATGNFTVSGGFGCNGKSAQSPVIADGTIATIESALKANGVMS